MNTTLTINTSNKLELINITAEIKSFLSSLNMNEGICLVFVPHATAALVVNEDEPGFKADIETLIKKWVPEGEWLHNKVDNNAVSHLAASLIGQTKTFPIQNGNLVLGTWQEIFLVELDGPRSARKVVVQVIKEK